jgi:hypothetical protein
MTVHAAIKQQQRIPFHRKKQLYSKPSRRLLRDRERPQISFSAARCRGELKVGASVNRRREGLNVLPPSAYHYRRVLQIGEQNVAHCFEGIVLGDVRTAPL